MNKRKAKIKYTRRPTPAREQSFFMDLTDFDCELGNVDHTEVYYSAEDLKRMRPCANECGIAEVKITLLRIVQPRAEFTKEESWEKPSAEVVSINDETALSKSSEEL